MSFVLFTLIVAAVIPLTPITLAFCFRLLWSLFKNVELDLPDLAMAFLFGLALVAALLWARALYPF